MEAFHQSPIGFPFPYGFPNTTVMNICSNTTSPISNTWMDTRIWSRLPQRLIDRIIAFLPPPAFFRARSVCKRWYSLLFSASFLEIYLQVSPHCPWFIFFKHKSLKSYIYRGNNVNNSGENHRAVYEGYLLDPQTVTWYRLYFPLIPPGFSPAAASGGLIAWISEEAGSKNILLSNPLVGSLIPIPPTLRPRLFPSIGMNITETSIDLAMAGDDLISPYAVKNLTTESFHIDANGFYSIWGTTSPLPRLCSFEAGEMAYSEGKFFCMNHSPFSVLCLTISSNIWCKIQAPMRRFLRSPGLVQARGRLIMVAAVEKSNLNVPRSLRLWALQDCATMWVEIERMPQQLYGQFSEIENGQGFSVVGHGEFVVIMIKNSDKALLFDFGRKRWLWVPPCPFLHHGGGGYGVSGGGGGGEELHGFAYEPRLAAPVTGLLDQLTLPFQSFTG